MGKDKYIHIIVDGELAGTLPCPAAMGENGQERMIASFMSNPTFVINEERVALGSTWDGEKFNPPVE